MHIYRSKSCWSSIYNEERGLFWRQHFHARENQSWIYDKSEPYISSSSLNWLALWRVGVDNSTVTLSFFYENKSYYYYNNKKEASFCRSWLESRSIHERRRGRVSQTIRKQHNNELKTFPFIFQRIYSSLWPKPIWSCCYSNNLFIYKYSRRVCAYHVGIGCWTAAGSTTSIQGESILRRVSQAAAEDPGCPLWPTPADWKRRKNFFSSSGVRYIYIYKYKDIISSFPSGRHSFDQIECLCIPMI